MNCLLGFTVHGVINESVIGINLTFYEAIKVTHCRQRGTSLLISCPDIAVKKQKIDLMARIEPDIHKRLLLLYVSIFYSSSPKKCRCAICIAFLFSEANPTAGE